MSKEEIKKRISLDQCVKEVQAICNFYDDLRDQEMTEDQFKNAEMFADKAVRVLNSLFNMLRPDHSCDDPQCNRQRTHDSIGTILRAFFMMGYVEGKQRRE